MQRNVSGGNAPATVVTGTLERNAPNLTVNEKDTIEMSVLPSMRGTAGIERSSTRPAPIVNLNAAIAASGSGPGSGSGSGTNSSADTGSGCMVTAALMKHQQLAAAGRDVEEGTNPNLPTSATRMYMERDTFGETSMTNVKQQQQQVHTASVNDSNVNLTTTRRASGISQLSVGEASLDFPVFRKGRRTDWDEWDDEYASDASSLDDGISSEDGGGAAWDYGYAWAQAMMERERERTDKDRATNLTLNQSLTQTQIPGQSGTMLQGGTNASGLAAAFLNNWQQKQRVQQQQRQQQALRAQRDSLQVVSGVSSRYGHGHGHGLAHPTVSSMYRHTAHVPPPIEEGEDMIFAPNDGDTFDQYHLSGAAGDDTSILIIGGGARDPSINEPSVYKAASVAATRASTGSLWSTYTYPKPMAFPDLDEDLVGVGVGLGGPAGENAYFYDPDVRNTAASSSAGAGAGGDKTRVASASGADEGTRVHPYATGGEAGGEEDAHGQASGDQSKRRWNVHPLKRMVEMGRLRR